MIQIVPIQRKCECGIYFWDLGDVGNCKLCPDCIDTMSPVNAKAKRNIIRNYLLDGAKAILKGMK